MKTTLFSLQRSEFRSHVNHALHPREEIDQPDQLKDRDKELESLKDCFETPGAQGFLWGMKGVGKTSLAHTACEAHDDIVKKVAAVACERDTSFTGLLMDITRKVVHGGHVKLDRNKKGAKINLFGLEISGETNSVSGELQIDSVNHAVDLFSTILGQHQFSGTIPVVIVDEFDRLENKETKRKITDFVKALSVGGSKVKLVICGIANSLNELIELHASSPRYLHQVEVKPLTFGGMLQIVDDIEQKFDLAFSKGQRYRIAQISDGYAHFTHLMLKDILMEAHRTKFDGGDVPQQLFKDGIVNSVKQAEAHLVEAYKKAVMRGTDINTEILWSVAKGPHLGRQFKEIRDDYLEIMSGRENRTVADEQKVRNSLNAMCEEPCGCILTKKRTGWYEFSDPVVRSYVRLVAESEGADLGEYNFRD